MTFKSSDGEGSALVIPEPGEGPSLIRFEGAWSEATGPLKGAEIRADWILLDEDSKEASSLLKEASTASIVKPTESAAN